MRWRLITPTVQLEVSPEPTGCPRPGCGGRHVQFGQAVLKPLRDTKLDAVIAHRYRGPRCGRTFRVDPVGVGHGRQPAGTRRYLSGAHA